MQRALMSLLVVLILGGGAFVAYLVFFDQKKGPRVELPANPVKMDEGGRMNQPAADPGKGAAGTIALGNLAPDIEGQDVDGKVFKLSDYRGKVVALDFWGFW